jgi:hypothetical protein
MDPEHLADELAIQNLVHRYADAVVRRDADAWGSTWADDGEWRVLGNAARGREAVVELWLGLMEQLPFVLQQATGGLIDFAGDTQDAAKGRWYISEHGFMQNGSGMLNLGVYHDDYIRENGEWRFALRRFDSLYMGKPDLSGSPIPFPEDV